jgi:hypothetical protein
MGGGLCVWGVRLRAFQSDLIKAYKKGSLCSGLSGRSAKSPRLREKLRIDVDAFGDSHGYNRASFDE